MLLEQITDSDSNRVIRSFRNLPEIGDGQCQKNWMLQAVKHDPDTFPVLFRAVGVAKEAKAMGS